MTEPVKPRTVTVTLKQLMKLIAEHQYSDETDLLNRIEEWAEQEGIL